MIVLTEIQFLGMALAIIGAVFGMIILVISIKRYAPEAFIFMKARKRSIPVAFVHYPDGIVKPYIPRVEIKNPESVAPYYSIGDVGIKFTNPDGSTLIIVVTQPNSMGYFEFTLDNTRSTLIIVVTQLIT